MLIFDHLGRQFKSKVEMCKFWNIDINTFNYRKKLGWGLCECLTTPKRENNVAVIKDHLGNIYKSKQAMCDMYNIGLSAFDARIKSGKSLEYALTIPSNRDEIVKDHEGVIYASKSDMCKAYGVSQTTYEGRIKSGLTVEEALTKENNRGKRCKDHEGNFYKNKKVLCAKYNITPEIYDERMKAGWDLTAVLTIPSVITIEDVYRDAWGNIYTNWLDVLRVHKISNITYESRLLLGNTVEQALLGVDLKPLRKYPTVEKLCEVEGISKADFEVALLSVKQPSKAITKAKRGSNFILISDHLGNTFNSVDDICLFYDISIQTFVKRSRLGWTLEEALSPLGALKLEDGTFYNNEEELCKEYNVPINTFKVLRREGHSLEEALTKVKLAGTRK